MKPLKQILAWVLAAGISMGAAAQHVVKVELPDDLCAGSSSLITFGYLAADNVQIFQPVTTQHHAERVFLPDGVSCSPYGCSYRSPLTFDAFAEGATVTSAQDIYYVRLNIEHSWIADIHINITCPNGQSASLMKYSGSATATTACISEIPYSRRGWNGTRQNVTSGTYLGRPYDHANRQARCDSSADGNQPGVGWNYCWSQNTTQGYTYAHTSTSDDGIIYRKGHSTGGTIDSSNVARGRNFYKPDENFSNLIGCPLNGEWYIEVIDAWSGDNGYVFDWELSLNAERVEQEECTLAWRDIIGPYISRVNDSLFRIDVPESLQADTTITYTIRIINSCGDTTDYTSDITLHPSYHITGDTVVCDSYREGLHTYTETQVLNTNTVSAFGCDSVVSLDLTVHHSSRTTIRTTVTENELPFEAGGVAFHAPVTDTTIVLSTTDGCDSLVFVSLNVWPNVETFLYRTECSNNLPVEWNGVQFGQADSVTLRLLTVHGSDSLVHMRLFVNHPSDTTIRQQMREADLPALFMGRAFYTDTDTVLHILNAAGCDSAIHYVLTVNWTRYVTVRRSACANELPLVWDGVAFYAADSVVRTLPGSRGFDSVVTMILTVNPTYDILLADTVCDNVGYDVAGQHFDGTGLYNLRLLTAAGCDSLVHLDLTVYPHNETHAFDTICSRETYAFDGHTYTESGVYVHPYTNRYGCDSLQTLHLHVISEDFAARIKSSAYIVTPTDREVQLLNISRHEAAFLWMLPDGDTSTAPSLTYSIPADSAQVTVRLVAYSLQGCTDTAATLLKVDNALVVSPNVFTPGEETNNRWFPVTSDITSIEVWIYDRQGNLVAHWDTADGSWDGTNLQGGNCRQAAYVYRMNYRTAVRPDRLQTQVGTIMLVR